MAKILNSLLCSVIVFLLTFAWVYFCLKDDTLALLLSVIVACCSCYLIWRAQSAFETNKRAKKAQKKQIADFCEYLRFGEDNAKLFAEMLTYYRFETTPIDYDSLTVRKNGQTCHVAICFSQDSLGKDDLRKAVIAAKREKCDKLYIFTNKATAELVELANRHVNTQIVDVANTYALFEQCDKLPNCNMQKATPKPSFVASFAFNRRRFGWYFTSALFLTVMSAFAYFPWYTLTWATVMTGLAVYSLLNKKYNALPTRVELD